MKIYAPSISDQTIGGGYTFLKNFLRGVANISDVEIVTDGPHDILFAFSPSTISGEIIERSKAMGAKFVLRIDGVPEDNRNSGKGTRRLVEYSRLADFIIFQTKFVESTVGRILKDNGVNCPSKVIFNGVDLDIFNPEGPKIAYPGAVKILNIAYRKDNNKRYEEVVQMYREVWTYRKDFNLLLMGRYPTEWIDYNYGFFNGEQYQQLGVITDDAFKAQAIRSCDVLFFPSFADPSPNVVLEALACGVPVIYCGYGGTKELVGSAGIQLSYNISYLTVLEHLMAHKNEFKTTARAQAENFSIDFMIKNYLSVFDRLINPI